MLAQIRFDLAPMCEVEPFREVTRSPSWLIGIFNPIQKFKAINGDEVFLLTKDKLVRVMGVEERVYASEYGIKPRSCLGAVPILGGRENCTDIDLLAVLNQI